MGCCSPSPFKTWSRASVLTDETRRPTFEEKLRKSLPSAAPQSHKKANGVLKLTYLHMLGYPVDFASFYILEVMSRTEFAHKRVGYLAAGQVFSPTTDVLLLTTNLFKKDITAGRLSDCSHALNCVAKVATAELARELAPDVVTLLASPRPYIRKKATLTLYSLVAASPDILPAATVRLKDRLSTATRRWCARR